MFAGFKIHVQDWLDFRTLATDDQNFYNNGNKRYDILKGKQKIHKSLHTKNYKTAEKK